MNFAFALLVGPVMAQRKNLYVCSTREMLLFRLEWIHRWPSRTTAYVASYLGFILMMYLGLEVGSQVCQSKCANTEPHRQCDGRGSGSKVTSMPSRGCSFWNATMEKLIKPEDGMTKPEDRRKWTWDAASSSRASSS